MFLFQLKLWKIISVGIFILALIFFSTWNTKPSCLSGSGLRNQLGSVLVHLKSDLLFFSWSIKNPILILYNRHFHYNVSLIGEGVFWFFVESYMLLGFEFLSHFKVWKFLQCFIEKIVHSLSLYLGAFIDHRGVFPIWRFDVTGDFLSILVMDTLRVFCGELCFSGYIVCLCILKIYFQSGPCISNAFHWL